MNFLHILRAAYEDALDGIVISDPDTVIMDCNPAYAQMTGYTRDELIGQRTNVIRSGLTPASVFADMWQSLHTRGKWVGELINRHKSGSLWISFLSITRVQDADGKVVAYVGIARDLTERRRLEEQLRESTTRMMALLESIDEAVAMFDTRNHCAVTNRRLTELLGVGVEALADAPWQSFRERLRAVFREADLLDDPGSRATLTLTTREERSRHFRVYRAPVSDAHGTVLGRLYAFRDVTREAEVDRMKSEFIATVSHELRTPMTSVKGALGLLLGGAMGPVPEAQRELLTIALSNSDRLIRLINDILDLSRIEAGRLELHREPIDLNTVVQGALRELEGFRSQRDIQLSVALAPDLPQALADPDRIGQVLVNLVGNALKFTDPGGHVTVRTQKAGDEVQVAVADTGPGIPPEHLESIFERFHRAGGQTAGKGGTGLGLAICKAIVREHGGRIWAESELGRGSVFTFALPAAAPVLPESAADAPPADASAGRTVLICDDDPDIVRLLSLALEQEGFRPIGVTSGEEALRRCKAEPVDCITLDLAMPGLHGLEVARRLKEDPDTRHIPVVVVSAYVDQHRSELALLGVAGVVPKPVDPAQLMAQIAAAVGEASRPGGAPDVLVVDDDPAMRRVVELVLREAGYSVRTAEDGEAAFRAVKDRIPDLMVCDILMPNMDGFRLVRLLQENPRTRRIPLLILTVLDLTEGERVLLRLGRTALLPKGPKLREQVVQRVRELLTRG